VAYHLNVTPRTIAFHKYTMMDQLQLKSSAELIQYAMKSSIVAA
jgi:DNA-binding NarL/FixJ family response regulator